MLRISLLHCILVNNGHTAGRFIKRALMKVTTNFNYFKVVAIFLTIGQNRSLQ